MVSAQDLPRLRIGELARRVGVSEHVLRAWEMRYGLLRPMRSAGGFRLYSSGDEWRVLRMQEHMAAGLSAAQAARSVLTETVGNPSSIGRAPGNPPSAGAGLQSSTAGSQTPPDAADPQALRRLLGSCLDAFDEPGAQALFDRMLAELSLPTVLRDVLVPYLAELGERWERGDVNVAQEHFASNLLRGRIAGLARDWGSGYGPRALLACAPGDQHELALMMFGITLHRNGWRIDYLGPSTPLADLAAAVEAARPDLVVVSATLPGTLGSHRRALRTLAQRVPLALGGSGVPERLAEAIGARHLVHDPVTEAESLAATW